MSERQNPVAQALDRLDAKERAAEVRVAVTRLRIPFGDIFAIVVKVAVAVFLVGLVVAALGAIWQAALRADKPLKELPTQKQ